jgi:hypothetical protein
MFKILISFCLFFSIEHGKTCEILNAIPIEDQQILERFFGYLTTNTEFGYTLCGQKPMSIEWCENPFLDPDFGVRFFDLSFDYLIISQGIRTWEKYESLFPKDRFAIVSYHSHCNLLAIAIINMYEILKIIQENRDIVEAVLPGQTINRETIYRALPIIETSEALLGLLLGFGRNNALAFEKRDYLGRQLMMNGVQWGLLPEKEKDFVLRCKSHKTHRNFLKQTQHIHHAQLAKEWIALQERMRSFPNEEYESRFGSIALTKPLGFVIHDIESNQEEIAKLVFRYRIAKQNIVDTFRGKPILPAVIALFLTHEVEFPNIHSRTMGGTCESDISDD